MILLGVINKFYFSIKLYKAEDFIINVGFVYFIFQSGSHKPILEATFSMAKKAVEIKPADPDINAEYGYQCLYLGKTNKALTLFKNNDCDRAVVGKYKFYSMIINCMKLYFFYLYLYTKNK